MKGLQAIIKGWITKLGEGFSAQPKGCINILYTLYTVSLHLSDIMYCRKHFARKKHLVACVAGEMPDGYVIGDSSMFLYSWILNSGIHLPLPWTLQHEKRSSIVF